MGWDEGDAIFRAEKIPETWEYTTQREGQPALCETVEGHPAFSGMVIAAGHWLAGAWLPPLEAWRFGPIVLLAAAVGAMFYRMAADYSPAAGIGAAAALLLMPRVFAHAHFAAFDGPLVSCWILTWAAFAPACRRWRAALLWGILLGATLSCKATGWLAPIPFIAWTVVYWDRGALKALTGGLPTALAVFFLLNPPLWNAPIGGLIEFFDLNLHRGDDPGLNISTQFFGRMYNLDFPLPWYNTLVWVGVTVPVGILLLAGVGLIAVVRSHCRGWPSSWGRLPTCQEDGRSATCPADRAGMLLVLNWLILLIVRAIPGTPPHDAERLILPSFAFLATLAGVGCLWSAAIYRRFLGAPVTGELSRCVSVKQSGATMLRMVPAPHSKARPGRPWHTMAFVGLVYVGSASSLFWYAPQWLSYYNLLIGGLPGATARGMEPTYYWDGLDRDVLDWLNANTAEDECICFAAVPNENLYLLEEWGKLDRPWTVFRGGPLDPPAGNVRWYVLQRRPSARLPGDAWLIENAEPAFRKTIRPGGCGPWRFDVPLVEVYAYRDHLRAVARAPAVMLQ